MHIVVKVLNTKMGMEKQSSFKHSTFLICGLRRNLYAYSTPEIEVKGKLMSIPGSASITAESFKGWNATF